MTSINYSATFMWSVHYVKYWTTPQIHRYAIAISPICCCSNVHWRQWLALLEFATPSWRRL